jgi:hypothetical protein
MTRVYSAALPEVFPYQVSVPDDLILQIITYLAYPRKEAPNGSSFAITSDAPRGRKNIWLSVVSYTTLVNNHIIPAVEEIKPPS